MRSHETILKVPVNVNVVAPPRFVASAFRRSSAPFRSFAFRFGFGFRFRFRNEVFRSFAFRSSAPFRSVSVS